jgi:hypothetical protein
MSAASHRCGPRANARRTREADAEMIEVREPLIWFPTYPIPPSPLQRLHVTQADYVAAPLELHPCRDRTLRARIVRFITRRK